MLTTNQKLANRYFLAFKDMEDADRYLRACNQLQEMQEEHGGSIFADHCEGLLCAAIIAYCRPFKKNRSKDFADALLQPDQVDALGECIELHQLLIEKRDTFIAHADWSARSTELVAIESDGVVLRQSPMPSVQKGLDLSAFGRLIEEVGVECRRRTYRLDVGSY